MKTPLLYQVYRALRRGWKRLTPEAQQALRAFVASQKTANGYLNAGGREDAYYGQFGRVFEAVVNPVRLLCMKIHLDVPESRGRDTVYARFFDFLEKEMRLRRPKEIDISVPKVLTTNAVCCLLAMQHQTGQPLDKDHVEWLRQRQDASGGFYASEQAPIPDLLSTAVAQFTLRLIGVPVNDTTAFIQAHWREDGGFTPSLLDDYSDVEYVFYGLMGLGTLKR